MKQSLQKLVNKKAYSELLDGISDKVFDGVLNAIEDAQQDISIRAIKLHRLVEPEDPDWEELVFDVAVEATPKEAFAFWDRIGANIQEMMDEGDDVTKEQLVNTIAVHVRW
jgi:hypothetical protein